MITVFKMEVIIRIVDILFYLGYMAQEIIGLGNNIKCYDKIRLTNALTGQNLHGCNFQWSSGSKNQGVSCHKSKDESDWFVPIKADQPSSSYYFKYTDTIHLSHSLTKKYLQSSPQYQSTISKKIEISLVAPTNKSFPQEWIVQCVENNQDQFWRVGELITIKNKDGKVYLASHKKRIKENDQYEVYAQKIKIDSTTATNKPNKNKQAKMSDQFLWRVTESIPFIYTPPIIDKKKPKQNQEEEQLKRLMRVSNQITSKSKNKKIKDTEQILKMENRRLQQVQIQTKRVEKQKEKVSCWRKLCCCLCFQSEGYIKIQ